MCHWQLPGIYHIVGHISAMSQWNRYNIIEVENSPMRVYGGKNSEQDIWETLKNIHYLHQTLKNEESFQK